MRNLLFTLFLSMFFIGKISAQAPDTKNQSDTAKIYKIELHDGTVFIANILHRDSANVVIKTASIPRIEVPSGKIERITLIEKTDIQHGKYWFPNPNPTRYLFGPVAFNLKKGEGYYQNTYLFINSVNVGISDHFSFGGGIEFLSTFSSVANGNFNPIFFLTPKFGYKISDKFHAGVGILFVSVPDLGPDGRNSFGTVYGLGTYGTVDHNLTLGLGWGYSGKNFTSNPFITVSGLTRVARSIALLSENWFIPGGDKYYSIFSYGIRFFGEKLAVDLAFLNNSDIARGLPIGVPYIDFVVKF